VRAFYLVATLIQPPEREHDMRDLTQQIESWLEIGVYDAVRVRWLATQMSDDDLISMVAYGESEALLRLVREVLEDRGLDPDGNMLSVPEELEFDFGL
jgi:uncharacterized protein YaeQ